LVLRSFVFSFYKDFQMKSSVLTAEQALTQVQEQAERIKSDETQRFPEAASVGDTHRQGDVYITLLDKLPEGAKIDRKAGLQLAPGSTQGSRHILDSREGVTIYRLSSPGMLDGPVLRCKQERTITHPEHGDVVLPPGLYQIGYQQNLDQLERAQRVLD
jgi:hypothetical protein